MAQRDTQSQAQESVPRHAAQRSRPHAPRHGRKGGNSAGIGVAAAIAMLLIAGLFFGVRAVLAGLANKPASSTAASPATPKKSSPKPSAKPASAPPAAAPAPVPVANPATDQAVPVLMYHHIMPVPNNLIAISPSTFDEQMRYLRDHGWHPVSMAQFEEFVFTGKRLPVKPVLITFDDGRSNQLTYGVPILKKYGFTATFFVVKKWIDGKSKSFMHVPELKQLAGDGFGVESHTTNHMMMRRFQSRTTKQWEGYESMKKRLWYPTYGMRVWMDATIGVNVTAVAYPGGGYDKYSPQLMRDAGYKVAFTTASGYVTYKGQSPLLLPRWNSGARGLRMSTFASIFTRAERYKPKTAHK
jgi:peptidoglycan/xylan/chitin deacetylase (PgdA/CDA1 family)